MNYCARMPRRRSSGASNMIEMRRAQRSFGDGLIAEEVSDLREDCMRHAGQVLADEQMVAAVYEALGKRHPKSRSRGRLGTPAEVVLRPLISSASATGAMACSSARYAPIWCTATSPAWAARRRPTPRRWGAGAWRWLPLPVLIRKRAKGLPVAFDAPPCDAAREKPFAGCHRLGDPASAMPPTEDRICLQMPWRVRRETRLLSVLPIGEAPRNRSP